jgi:DNA polymerase elongation subunit (family B)
VIDEKLTGSTTSEDGEVTFRRVSHGDTDSFFVKYADIYSPFVDRVDKEVEVILIKGNEIVSRNTFDPRDPEQLQKSKRVFNTMAGEFIPEWKDMDNESKAKAFFEGILFGKDYRLLYNRWNLTDFCRILDATIMENKLAEIMQRFADRWSYYQNTLFLKREKCILKAIVTAKKKYICYIESNEDAKYKHKTEMKIEPKFGITGLEIVRSSTIPFARERLLGLIDLMMQSLDKTKVLSKYLEIKTEFFEIVRSGDTYQLSIPSGISQDPPDWRAYLDMTDEQKSKVDWRLRSASVWNYLIESEKALANTGLEPIFQGSKVKFIKVMPNPFDINVLAFIGDTCPEPLLSIFTPDWEEQWDVSFARTMSRLFEAVGWSKDFEYDQTDLMMEMY